VFNQSALDVQLIPLWIISPPSMYATSLLVYGSASPGVLVCRYQQAYRAHQHRVLPPACEQDLEGIVAKAKHAAYGQKWFKIRNAKYSQYEGRRGLFESRRQAVG